MRKHHKQLKEVCEAAGFPVLSMEMSGGNHIQLLVLINGEQRKVSASLTPSDINATKQVVRQLRKIERGVF